MRHYLQPGLLIFSLLRIMTSTLDHVSYRASCYLPENDQWVKGRLKVSESALEFSGQKEAKAMPLFGLEIKRGGTNGRLVFFTHPSLPGISFSSAEQKILQILYNRGDSKLRESITSLGQKRNRTLLVEGFWLAVLGALICLSWQMRGVFLRQLTYLVPVSWETALGDAALKALQFDPRSVEKSLSEDLSKISAPLLQSISELHFPVRVIIRREKEVNAFALPGGIIVINSGLIKRVETPEEILGVIAHEAGHISARHSMQQIVAKLGLAIAWKTLVGDLSDLESLLLQGSSLLLEQKFSRDHEREADSLAWKYLTAAGISPQGLLAFFKRLKSDNEALGVDSLEKAAAFLATHPTTEERLNMLEEKMKDYSEVPGKAIVDWAAFKLRMETALSASETNSGD